MFFVVCLSRKIYLNYSKQLHKIKKQYKNTTTLVSKAVNKDFLPEYPRLKWDGKMDRWTDEWMVEASHTYTYVNLRI